MKEIGGILYVLSESAEILTSKLSVSRLLQKLTEMNVFTQDVVIDINMAEKEPERVRRVLDEIYQRSLSCGAYNSFMAALKQCQEDLYSEVKEIELQFEGK